MLLFYIFIPVVLLFWAVTTAYTIIFFKKKEKGYYKPLFLIIVSLCLLDLLIEPYLIHVRQENLDAQKLAQPIKIAIMSDFHLRPLKRAGFVDNVAKKLQNIKPDLIIIVGDFLFFDHVDEFTPDLLHFKKITDIAPTYAVLGNHEYGIGNIEHSFIYPNQSQEIKNALEKVGVQILVDQNTKVTVKGENFWLVGFDEYWNYNTHPAKALTGLDDKLLKIGLSHNPDMGYLPQTKILDILVSGHTHGGQVRIPFIGSLVNAETLFPKEDYGKFITAGVTKILNTSGLGESGLPIRFFDLPEIVELTIK